MWYGQIQRAIRVVDIDSKKLNSTEEETTRRVLSKRFLMATNWMCEAELAGTELLER